MDIGDNECHRCGTPVFDPVHSRPEFGEYLAGTKLLCCSIVMVVGEDPGEQVDDRGIALMAVQTDMAARRHDRTAQTQFAILNAVDLLDEIDGGEHLLADQVIVGRRDMLPQNEACRQEPQPCITPMPRCNRQLAYYPPGGSTELIVRMRTQRIPPARIGISAQGKHAS